MRDINFRELVGVEENFHFGNQAHRVSVLSTMYSESKNFTFGHYGIGESGGIITVGGAICDGKLYYAVSICSPLDNFSKAVGREKVKENFSEDGGNAKRGVLGVADVAHEKPAVVLKMAAQSYLSKRKGLPRWAKEKVSFRKK